jgi:hypothetical protein
MEDIRMSFIDHNDKCPECGQRKNHHPTTGEYCLYCGWVGDLHTPGPWMVTRDPGSEIGARLLEPAIKEQRFFEEWDSDHPNYPFMEALIELHNANTDRLIEALPELYRLYLMARRIADEGWSQLKHELLRRAVAAVEMTRVRHLDRNVKKLMEGK